MVTPEFNNNVEAYDVVAGVEIEHNLPFPFIYKYKFKSKIQIGIDVDNADLSLSTNKNIHKLTFVGVVFMHCYYFPSAMCVA